MRGARWLALAVALGWAAGARAQSTQAEAPAGNAGTDQAANQAGQFQGPQSQQYAAPSAQQGGANLAEACVGLLEGRAASGQSPEALRSQCELLILNGARVQAGEARQAVQPGESAMAAFQQAGRELVGGAPRPAMGLTSRGPVRYTVMTDPVGWFSGVGTNLELQSPIQDFEKFSWLVGARYSRTDATNGTATAFGMEGGVDWFIIGLNNSGLRVGPRLELALGQENFSGTTTFGRVGLGGELGYNFIASNGLTGSAAVGLGGRIAGNQKNTNFNSFTGGGNLGPYFKLGVGYSW